MLEKGALAILVLSKASAWFEVGVTVVGGIKCSTCGPYHEKEEDRLDILVRLTLSLTWFGRWSHGG